MLEKGTTNGAEHCHEAPALQGDEAFEAQDEELELPAPSTEVPVNQATFMDFGPTDLVLEEPEGTLGTVLGDIFSALLRKFDESKK